MGEDKATLSGPDLEQGVELSMIPDNGMLLGHARGEPVMLVRRGSELFAVGAICTHYGAPLETGLLVGDTVRCPWHHACSACAPAKHCVRRRETRFHAGMSRSCTT